MNPTRNNIIPFPTSPASADAQNGVPLDRFLRIPMWTHADSAEPGMLGHSYSVIMEEGGGVQMTADDVLKAYMDKVSQEQTTLRQDMRDSTARTDHRLDRIEDMIRANNAAADARMDRTDARMDRMEAKMDSVIESVAGLRDDIVSVKQDIVAVKQDIVAVKQDIVDVKREAVDRETAQRRHITATLWTAIGVFATALSVLITWLSLRR